MNFQDVVPTQFSIFSQNIDNRKARVRSKTRRQSTTSVDQIERFYARNLPLSLSLSRDMAINLQSFGRTGEHLIAKHPRLRVCDGVVAV